MNRSTRSRWVAFCLLALGAHLALVVTRVPARVYAKRAEEIGRYRAEGAARWLLENARLGGADTVEWLSANTSPDQVVLWRGDPRGAFEVMAALLWPRLLVAESSVEPTATSLRMLGSGENRALARGTLPDGRAGVVVVEATRADLRLEVR